MLNRLQKLNESLIVKLSSLAIVLALFLSFSDSIAQNRITKINKSDAMVNNLDQTKKSVQSFYDGSITLQGPVHGQDYIITPEVLTGISGYYDWQTNGACPRYLYYAGPDEVHAIMMIATDSADNQTSRRTSYAFSNDGGVTWTLVAQEVPNIRSGFPSLTMVNNVAAIANHFNNPQGVLTTGMSVDAFTGLGSFTTTVWTPSQTNFIWPFVERFSNGSLLIGAQTYQSGVATDTSLVVTFDPISNAWGPHNFLTSPSTNNANMRWSVASGPNGAGIYVQNPISDAGSSIGDNRIFYFTTDNNGATWSGPNLLFESGIYGGDTVAAWLGMNAVYDAAGNFYVTWNNIYSLFVDAKLFASKNGGPPMLVADHSMLPGIAPALVSSLGNACTIDWPSISVSDDGEYVFVAYSVAMEADTLNGFNAFELFYSVAHTSDMDFVSFTPNPVNVTHSGTDDIRYVSLNRVALTDGANTYKLPLVYLKDPQPGSCAFADNAPISRSHLVYREILQAHIVGITNNNSSIPQDFALNQNYPNPFNPSTKISFNLPVNSNVTLVVYDATGRMVAQILNNVRAKAGVNEVDFNASELPSGVYFYSIQAGDFRDTKKMMLIK